MLAKIHQILLLEPKPDMVQKNNKKKSKTKAPQPTTVDGWKDKGNAECLAKDWASAEASFSAAITLSEQSGVEQSSTHILYSNRSAAFAALGEYNSALNDAQTCVDLQPRWAKGIARKGAALEGLDRLKEAEEVYQQALALDPMNPWRQEALKRVAKQVQSESMKPAHVRNPYQWHTKAYDLVSKYPPRYTTTMPLEYRPLPNLYPGYPGWKEDPSSLPAMFREPIVWDLIVAGIRQVESDKRWAHLMHLYKSLPDGDAGAYPLETHLELFAASGWNIAVHTKPAEDVKSIWILQNATYTVMEEFNSGVAFPRNCESCKQETERVCVCNEAYCSKACQLKDWPDHRRACETVHENAHLAATATGMLWMDRYDHGLAQEIIA